MIHNGFYPTSIVHCLQDLRGSDPITAPSQRLTGVSPWSESKASDGAEGLNVDVEPLGQCCSGHLVLVPGQSPLEPFYQHCNVLGKTGRDDP